MAQTVANKLEKIDRQISKLRKEKASIKQKHLTLIGDTALFMFPQLGLMKTKAEMKTFFQSLTQDDHLPLID